MDKRTQCVCLKDLSLDPHHPCKTLDIATHVCNLALGQRGRLPGVSKNSHFGEEYLTVEKLLHNNSNDNSKIEARKIKETLRTN